jgi:hypothetical protein
VQKVVDLVVQFSDGVMKSVSSINLCVSRKRVIDMGGPTILLERSQHGLLILGRLPKAFDQHISQSQLASRAIPKWQAIETGIFSGLGVNRERRQVISWGDDMARDGKARLGQREAASPGQT